MVLPLGGWMNLAFTHMGQAWVVLGEGYLGRPDRVCR